jgi:hypothetical protein
MSNGTTIQEANQFSLQSDTITVSYSSTSIAGVPQFTYRDLIREVSRSGDDIRREDTEIGTLVTIDVEAAPDAPTVSFSLVLPRINLGEGNQRVILQTFGVRTTDFTTAFLPGPILGQGQTYEVFDLRGLAQFVTF